MKTHTNFALSQSFGGTFGRTMLSMFAHDVRKNFAAHGTRLDFLPLERFADTFARTKFCVVARRKSFAADHANFHFGGTRTFSNFFAFGGAISVVAPARSLVFTTADRAGERRFFSGAARRFNCLMNFFVRILRDKLKIRNVVVVVIKVAVVNVVAVGNFAVVVNPHETMYADCATEIFADAFVEFEACEFFLRVADGLNRRHGAFDLANHFLDGERFLRSLGAFAKELEKFFTMFHGNASKFLTNSRRNVTMNAKDASTARDRFSIVIVAYRSVFRNVETKIFKPIVHAVGFSFEVVVTRSTVFSRTSTPVNCSFISASRTASQRSD